MFAIVQALRLRLIPRVVAGLLVMLALSVAGHYWHHVTDTDCDSPVRGSPHPCAQCSGFHGGVLAEEFHRTSTPHLSPLASIVLPEDADRVANRHGDASPRAPPPA